MNLLLVVLAVAGVFCAILTFTRTREFRTLSAQATFDKDLLMRVQSLAGEVNAYNQKNPSPALTQLLQPAAAKPGTR